MNQRQRGTCWEAMQLKYWNTSHKLFWNIICKLFRKKDVDFTEHCPDLRGRPSENPQVWNSSEKKSVPWDFLCTFWCKLANVTTEWKKYIYKSSYHFQIGFVFFYWVTVAPPTVVTTTTPRPLPSSPPPPEKKNPANEILTSKWF